MEYAVYPFEYMRITQRHDEGNHLAHWYPTPNPLYSDKPFDEATQDGGRGYFVPKNDYIVVEKTGNQSGGYNVRLKTANQVIIPYQTDAVILEVTLTHINYDDWSRLRVGQVIHTNERIIREGTSGKASGNHLHCTANIGSYSAFIKNSNGKYVFAYHKSLTPEQAFYIDGSVKILDAKGYNFKQVPSGLLYQAHVEGIGWQGWVQNGQTAGTTGQSKRVEAIQIDARGETYAKAHVQDIGWVDYGKITKDTVIGTTGQAKRLECLCLKGNFKYRVHIANVGWSTWTNADGICTLGSVGQDLSIEAIQMIEF